MEIYNRYLNLETLKLIFDYKKNKEEELIIYTDETKEYHNTLRFFNVKGVNLKFKNYEYKKDKDKVMDMIERGYLKETILKYAKSELSKNKFNEYNLTLLKKMPLEDYIELLTPYLIKKGYVIEDNEIYSLFKPIAKSAGSFVWYLRIFFLDLYFDEEIDFNYDLNKEDKDEFINQVETYLKNDKNFASRFIFKISGTILFDFDIVNYVKLSDFDYLIFKLYGEN